MATIPGTSGLLPKELLEIQLGQIDLLLAMYAEEDSVVFDDTLKSLVEVLRDWCGSDSGAPECPVPSSISMVLRLQIPTTAPQGEERTLELDILIPLAYEANHVTEAASEPPPAKVRMRQPFWLSKAEVVQITAEMPQEDDLFTTIEHMKEAMCQHLEDIGLSDSHISASKRADESIVRVWFYFPSISTRSKRDDLINHAPGYGLTGFLLAGKPGLLCVEGDSQQIDDYMKFIKTESWGDIPSHHKKVSERYRETGAAVERAFTDMQEITDNLGAKRGERANRNDMKALEIWLSERGLGEAMSKVLI